MYLLTAKYGDSNHMQEKKYKNAILKRSPYRRKPHKTYKMEIGPFDWGTQKSKMPGKSSGWLLV